MSITASIVPWPGRPALAGGWRSQGFVIIAGAALPRVRVKFAGSQDQSQGPTWTSAADGQINPHVARERTI